MQGRTGTKWNSWRLLTGTLAAVLMAAAPAAAIEDFVRVRVDKANLRSGPSTGTEPVRFAYENEPLRVVERKGSWLSIEDFRGSEGWIYGPLTDESPSVVVRGRLVNVRSGPSTNYEVVLTAERGVHFLVLGRDGKWLNVRHEDGEEGWIHQSLVWGNW
jgi:SH3-like domain-containing protein